MFNYCNKMTVHEFHKKKLKLSFQFKNKFKSFDIRICELKMGRQMTDDEILVFLYDSLKNPENVHFMPILNDRRVKECRVKYNNDKWSMVFDTLELFAFGTWEDYVRGRSDGRYLILNEEAFNLKILR
jgi:hypothetical protein